MQRNKTIAYSEDDLYDDEDDYAEEESTEYSEEDKLNFASLTPVVRAEIEEAGLQARDREIEDALWNYYWDVGKSVGYLKNAKQPKKGAGGGEGKKDGKTGTGKAKSRFDEAAERSKGVGVAGGVAGGELELLLNSCLGGEDWREGGVCVMRKANVVPEGRGGLYTSLYISGHMLTSSKQKAHPNLPRLPHPGSQTSRGRTSPPISRATSSLQKPACRAQGSSAGLPN